MRRRVFPLTKRGWRAAQRRDRRFRRMRRGCNLWELRHSRTGFVAKLAQYLRDVDQEARWIVAATRPMVRERGCPRCNAPLVEDPHHGDCPSEGCPFFGHARYSCVRALTGDECTFEGRCPQVLLDYERERGGLLGLLEARGHQLRERAAWRLHRREHHRRTRRRRSNKRSFARSIEKVKNVILDLVLGVGNRYLVYRARQNLLWTLKVREYILRLEAEGRSIDEFR